jgi:hypothetical protein
MVLGVVCKVIMVVGVVCKVIMVVGVVCKVLMVMGVVCKVKMVMGVYRVFVLKPEGKRPLGRPRCRLYGNIKMGLSGSGMWGSGLDRAGSG